MRKFNVFDKVSHIHGDIGDSSNCNIYGQCVSDIVNPWDQIYLIANVRLVSASNLKRIFKDNDSLLLLILIRLNAKFRFATVRKIFEIVHFLIEFSRLRTIVNESNSTKLVESSIFEEENSLMFYPSLKKSLKHFRPMALISGQGLKEEGKYSASHLLFYNSLEKPSSVERIIVKYLIGKLEMLIVESDIKELYFGGSMNMFNRVLALIFLKHDLTVVYKDHGYVRDCCAEFGIFSKAIPYTLHASRASKETHLNNV